MTTFQAATGFEFDALSALGTIGGAPVTSTAHARSVAGVGGSRSLKCAATGNTATRIICTAGSKFPRPTGTRTSHRFGLYVATFPTTGEVMVFAMVNSTSSCFVYIDSGGDLKVCTRNGGTFGTPQSFGTINAGQWYTIECEFDTSANPWNLRWRVDNAVQTTCQASAASLSLVDLYFGHSTGQVNTNPTGSWEFYLDDYAGSQTAGDYPIGNGVGLGYGISGVGTHNITTGTFADEGANAITAGDTTSYNKLTETTPDGLTTYVVQTGAKNTDYLEYALANTSGSSTPQMVMAWCQNAVATNTINNGLPKLHDGTTDTSFTVSASATMTFQVLSQATRAGAQGAWTTGAIDALTFRIGYNSSNPATSAVRLSWAFVEVDYAASYSVSDSGSVTAVAVVSGPDQLADSSPGPGSTVTDGTLGNNATHEPFTANIVYVEKYTVAASAIVSQYQWQGKGDNSGLSEHWKMVIYLDSGAGTTPGALLYVSPEQTVSGIGSTVTTQSISPTALTIPAGTIWVGIHLSENHLAPTYTNGGSALDSPDTYSDGPNDPWSGGGNTNDNLRDRLLTYIPNQDPTALAILTGSGQLTEQTGSVTAVAVPDGLGSYIDMSGTVTAVAVLTGEGDFISESGTVTVVAVISGQDQNDDTGSVTAIAVITGDDRQQDDGSVTAIVDVTAVEQGQDAGTVTVVSVLSGQDQILEQTGSVTATVVLDQLYTFDRDSGTVTATVVPALVMNGLADSGLILGQAGPFTQSSSLQNIIASSNIIAVVIATLGTQKIADTGSLTSVAVLAGGEYARDTGSVTALVVLSGAEAWSFAQTNTALAVLSLDFEALAETDALVIATALDGIEVFTDAGLQTGVSTPAGADALADLGSSTQTADFSVVEWIADTGDELAVADIRGFGFESSPTGSRKGYAYPSMTLRYNSRGIDARTGRVTLSATPTAGVTPNLSEPVVTTDQQANEAAANQF